jgi:hypothetical protein
VKLACGSSHRNWWTGSAMWIAGFLKARP